MNVSIHLYTQYDQLKSSTHFEVFNTFAESVPESNFFQSAGFFQLIGSVPGYQPFLLVAETASGAMEGSILGVFQSNGSGIKSWLSRRLIIWGGPLLAEKSLDQKEEVARKLLEETKKHAQGKAIFIEFRNFFDTSPLQGTFEAAGFVYKPHLNYLVKTDDEAAVQKRLSSNRKRQIKSSLKLGATIGAPESEQDILDFYSILQKLYKEKVKKPLPDPNLFLKFWKSPLARIFLIRYEGKVVGGIACPIYRNQVIYEWYVCGEDGLVKGLNPSVLATWAPIEYGLKNGYDHFDFMGAGKPDEDYGVRDFKARFGGTEVCFGRYEMVVNKPLYRLGKLGLQVYQKIT
ncbi:MAG: GNAT family N-acetyltransferase [Bacteroidetes bacterium]|nr:MAG: GNAT family N-acetyltransferase [Bacteroidota bacterium]